MSLSRRRPRRDLTPLGELAQANGLLLATRTWMERTVADVAFDGFAFGHDVLCDEPDDEERRAALERGWRVDGVVLAVGSLPFRATPIPWVAVQSKRGDDHLELEFDAEPDESRRIGHAAFDERFDVDVDDDERAAVRAILTDEVCEWAIALDDEHGPLAVIFDGAESESGERAQHGSAVFVARVVDDDAAFIATLGLTRELVDGFRAVTSH